MKVKKLIKLLEKENQNAQVGIYLGAEKGWEIVNIGIGDAIIGKKKTGKNNFVLLPAKVPNKLQKWGG
jgi:hypothetical protein